MKKYQKVTALLLCLTLALCIAPMTALAVNIDVPGGTATGLQVALNAANPNDTVTVTANMTLTGNVTVPVDVWLAIASGVTITNNGAITNEGRIFNEGAITNNGAIINDGGGVSSTNGRMHNNSTINNNTGGTITNVDTGWLLNNSTINNTGGINNSSNSTISNVGWINNITGGTITNDTGGVIQDNNTGIIDLTGGGMITNNGTITNNTLYEITFDANGGAGGIAFKAYTAPTTPLSVILRIHGAPTRPGYTLSSWNTLADGSGTAYSFSSDINAIIAGGAAPPYTIYAQWALSYSGGDFDWYSYFPTKPKASKAPEAPKPAFPVSGKVVGNRITVYELETLKTTLFRLNKGETFTVLGLASNGRAFRIEKDGREGFIALKDIGFTLETTIRATALEKAAAYIKQENGKLKRAGYFDMEQTLWIHGISGKYLINKQPNITYYLDAAQWRLSLQ